ncbi:MAG: glycosyltransferase [Ignavibacteria bacterium]
MKIVLLTSRFPYPLEKGDKLRIYNQIKNLSANNEITLISINKGDVKKSDIEQLEPFCKNIYLFKLSNLDIGLNLTKALFNGLPFQVGIFFKKGYRDKIHKIIKDVKPDAVYCHLIRMSEYLYGVNGCPKTLDYMDAFSKGIERRAKTSPYFMRRFLEIEYKRLVEYENIVFERFERKVIISEQDRDCIPHKENRKIEILPNGVDQKIFHPLERKKKYDLLFTGNMGYPPNIESAIYAAKEILPLVKKSCPEISLLIAGVNPPREIISLHSVSVHVIPEFSHIREAFAQSRIMLAPMLISIGLQNKILQAMAMKIPVVCSPLANNAIKAPVNKCILEADNPAEYVKHIMMLLNDKAFYESITSHAYKFVLQNYDWEVINKKLEYTILKQPHPAKVVV